MSLILALDTSAAVSVALLRQPELTAPLPSPASPDASPASAAVPDPVSGIPVDRVVARRHAYDPRRHAELLTPFITECLAEAGAELADVSGIVVGMGPGPFTGLRVGLVTARVLGAARGVPVHGVLSLDGLALAACVRLDLPEGTRLLVATDARRKEVYSAQYALDAARNPVRVAGPAVGPARELATVAMVSTCVGRGCLLYPDDLAPRPQPLEAADLLDPAADFLGLVALAELPGGVVPGAPVRAPEPEYLRRPDAVPQTVNAATP